MQGRKILLGVLTTALLVGMSWAGNQTIAQQNPIVFQFNGVPVVELDPAAHSDFIDSVAFYNVYDTLISVGPTGEIIPWVAESWEISPDATTFTFQLRRDVKFHDGSPLTAEDVVFSFNRFLALGLGFSFVIPQGLVDSVEALDEFTVQFKLSRPFSPFLATLARVGILNKDLVLANKQEGDFGEFGDYGQAFLKNHDAGSGAYQVKERRPEELLVLEKFPEYWGGFRKNAPDIVRIIMTTESSTIRTLMARREHDMTNQWQPNEVYAALAQDRCIDLVSQTGITGFYGKINTKKFPTNNLHFRRAIAFAIDYDAMIDVLRVNEQVSKGVRSRGPTPQGFPGFDPNLPLLKRDLDRAREELELSGVPSDQRKITVAWHNLVPLEERIALLWQQNLAEIGIDLEIQATPWNVIQDIASSDDETPHITEIFVAGNYPSPDSFLFNMYHTAADGTWMSMEHLRDPLVDQLIDAARAEPNPDKSLELYKQAQIVIWSEFPDIWGFDQVQVHAKQTYWETPFDRGETIAVMGMSFRFKDYQLDPAKKQECQG